MQRGSKRGEHTIGRVAEFTRIQYRVPTLDGAENLLASSK